VCYKARDMLVLASASPRRAELLRGAGIQIQVAPVDCDERWLPGETPPAYTARVARDKATLALPQHPRSVILAADTTVWLGEAGDPQARPIGKPGDRAEAEAMMRALTGAGAHRVTTAFVLADARGAEVRWLERQVTTRVHMRDLDEVEFAAYLDSEDWRDRAGGYGIQSRAAGIVTGIEGSYTSVVGLPLAEVLVALRELGLR
jgi:septum formation protein